MSKEKIHPKGITIFKKHDNAPDFVKGKMIISLNELVKFCKENPGYLTEYNGQKQLKLDVLEGKEGRLNLVVDTYKKETKQEVNQESSNDDTDLPF